VTIFQYIELAFQPSKAEPLNPALRTKLAARSGAVNKITLGDKFSTKDSLYRETMACANFSANPDLANVN